MREILFRGKRIDNGEWIKGDIIQFPVHGIIRIVEQGLKCKDAEVDSSTVGQCTGLTDKNGRKIFEGDIVKYKSGSNCFFHKVVFETRNYCGYFGIVISETETWGFGMEVPPNLFEVVGNIYDSLELVEVSE